ncbi:MAG: cas1 [Clostridia bacterium]|nr:cas1 [Clostridia bacterium]
MKKSFYFFNSGTLKRHDNTLQFILEDGTKKDIPIEQVEDIYIFSEMSFNTKLIGFLSQMGICVHFFNYYSFYTGSFYPKEGLVSGNLLVKQVQHYECPEKRLFIAQRIVEAASFNIYRNLRYYNGRGKDLEKEMKEIESLRHRIDKCSCITELMGVEGNIRKIYYETWNTIINQDIDFEKRVMHPPDNMINTLISYVNTLVYTRALSEIYSTQLNPTISYLHEPGTRRFSLSLDIAEVFKPLLADRLIFSLLNKNQVGEKSFTKNLNYLHLTQEAARTIVAEFDERLKTTIKHRTLQRDVSYRQLIRLEAYKLIKHLMGEKDYEGFMIWW